MLRMHAPLISFVLCSQIALAQNGTGGFFNFFEGRDIDYWGEGKRLKEPLSPAMAKDVQQSPSEEDKNFSGATLVRQADASAFSWENYRDPRKPEFWDDGGDWIPPRPFREAVANPSEQNIREYLAWQERKAGLVSKFQSVLSTQVAQQTRREEKPEKAKPLDWSQVKIAYFYQTGCAHCRASVPVIQEAERRGAQFTFVQLDSEKNSPLHAGSVPYDASWKAEFPVSATPTWLLKIGKNTTSRTGSLSVSALEEAAIELSQKENQ